MTVADPVGKFAGAWQARPPNWSAPKLTAAQRDEIVRRLTDGETPQALALEYGVTAKTIREYR